MSVESFIKYMQYEKRSSPHTLLAYQTDLQYFEQYLKHQFETDDPLQAGYPHIRSWVVSLVEDKVKPSSINRKISSLRSYYKYCIKSGRLQQNPMQKIVNLKTPKRLPVFFEEKQMQQLIAFMRQQATDYTTQLHRTIIETFYQTGMRLSELIQLTEDDIDPYNKQIKVLGKGNKERLIPIQPQLLYTITDLMQAKKNQKIFSENNLLFILENSKPLTPTYVRNMVKKYLTPVSTLSKKSPHVLRHTFATHLTNAGADINAVKELLGHASLAATQVYTHNTIARLKDIHKQAHPKS